MQTEHPKAVYPLLDLLRSSNGLSIYNIPDRMELELEYTQTIGLTTCQTRRRIGPDGKPSDEYTKVVLTRLGEAALLRSELEPSSDVEYSPPMTLKEIGKRLNIHKNTAGNLLRTGKLKGKKIGKFWSVDKNAL